MQGSLAEEVGQNAESTRRVEGPRATGALRFSALRTRRAPATPGLEVLFPSPRVFGSRTERPRALYGQLSRWPPPSPNDPSGQASDTGGDLRQASRSHGGPRERGPFDAHAWPDVFMEIVRPLIRKPCPASPHPRRCRRRLGRARSSCYTEIRSRISQFKRNRVRQRRDGSGAGPFARGDDLHLPA